MNKTQPRTLIVRCTTPFPPTLPRPPRPPTSERDRSGSRERGAHVCPARYPAGAVRGKRGAQAEPRSLPRHQAGPSQQGLQGREHGLQEEAGGAPPRGRRGCPRRPPGLMGMQTCQRRRLLSRAAPLARSPHTLKERWKSYCLFDAIFCTIFYGVYHAPWTDFRSSVAPQQA